VLKEGKEKRAGRMDTVKMNEPSSEIPKMPGNRGSLLAPIGGGGWVTQFRLRHGRKKVVTRVVASAVGVSRADC
jgi:hypothetical protein